MLIGNYELKDSAEIEKNIFTSFILEGYNKDELEKINDKKEREAILTNYLVKHGESVYQLYEKYHNEIFEIINADAEMNDMSFMNFLSDITGDVQTYTDFIKELLYYYIEIAYMEICDNISWNLITIIEKEEEFIDGKI